MKVELLEFIQDLASADQEDLAELKRSGRMTSESRGWAEGSSDTLRIIKEWVNKR